MSARNARPLAKIEADLEAAFKREAKGPIEIGSLLNEAKEQLDSHGQWLAWLKDKFPHAVRTAQNYMAAHKLAAKYAAVAHLKLSPRALYALAKADNDGDTDLIERVLQEPKTKWIDADRVREIANEICPPSLPSDEEDPGKEPDEQPPPLEGDDGRPPPPPPPGLNPKQARLVQDFNDAVAKLKDLLTKSAKGFVAASAPSLELEMVARFIQQVVELRKSEIAAEVEA